MTFFNFEKISSDLSAARRREPRLSHRSASKGRAATRNFPVIHVCAGTYTRASSRLDARCLYTRRASARLAFCRLLIFFSCRLTLTMHHISTKYMSVRSYGCVCLALSCVKLNTACPLSFSSFIVFPCTTTTLHSLFPRARPSKICLEPMDGSYSRADASRKQAPAGPGCPIFHFSIIIIKYIYRPYIYSIQAERGRGSSLLYLR